MPPYPGMRHSMELRRIVDEEETIDTRDDPDDWAAQYQAYLDEEELENEEAKGSQNKGADIDQALEGEDWAVQYAKYCEEKEREFFESC
mmetsp:Transcript_11289/g.24455  ORF Transcript_11289/g.24455 Transcript_11289/m.24455 type:complete len:89 (-) Transcript_11289:29-295(-)